MAKEDQNNRETPDLKVHAPTIKTIAELENFERGTVVREEGETDEEYARRRDVIMSTLQVIRRDLERTGE